MFKIFIVLSVFIVALNLFDICKNFSPAEKTNPVYTSQIKIGHFNILTKNNNYNKILQQAEKENLDIILLEEINETWLKNIEEIRITYPYYLEHPRDDSIHYPR